MSFLNVFLRAAAIVVKFVSLALITRGLGLEDLDIYFYFISVAAVVSPVFGLQTFHIVLRRYNTDNEKNIIDLQIYQYIASLLMVFVLLVFFYDDIKGEGRGYFIVLCGLVVSEILVTEFSRIFIVVSKSLFSNVLALTNSVSYLLYGSCLVFLGGAGFQIWQYVILLSIVVSVFLFCYVMRGVGYSFFSREFSFRDLFGLIKSSQVYFISQLLNMLMLYSSRFFLDSLGVAGLIACYSTLYAFSNVVTVFVSVGIIAPLSTKYLSSAKNSISKILLKTFLFCLALSVCLIITYDALVYFVGNYALKDFRGEFALLLLAGALLSLSQVLQLFFLKCRLDKVNLVSYASVAVLTVFLNYLYIAEYQILGAILILLLSSLLLLVVRVVAYIYYVGLVDETS